MVNLVPVPVLVLIVLWVFNFLNSIYGIAIMLPVWVSVWIPLLLSS